MSTYNRRIRSKTPGRAWPQEENVDAPLPRAYHASMQNGEEPPVDNPDITADYERTGAYNGKRIGDVLRSRREERGENLYTISDFLRIRPNFLAALENSRYDEFPADAYVIGFLRTYAQYLGLDSRAAIDQYRREMAGRRRKPQLSMPQPITEGRAPTVAILIGATMAALLLYGLWYGLSSSSRTVVETPPVLSLTAQEQPEPSASEQTSAAPMTPTESSTEVPEHAARSEPNVESITLAAPIPTAQAVPEPQTNAAVSTNAAKPADAPPVKTEEPAETPPLEATSPKKQVYGSPSGARISVRAEKETWVLVADARGNTVFDRIMNPGDVYHVPNAKGLRLTTGNGSGIILTVEGVDLPPLGRDSRIVRNVPLDADRLKELNARTHD